jgi:transposase-like protein
MTETRRRWTRQQRAALLATYEAGGISVVALGRRHDVARGRMHQLLVTARRERVLAQREQAEVERRTASYPQTG